VTTARKRARNRPYDLLAEFYDTVLPSTPAMNRHARKKALGKILENAGSVCELACGSGTTAIELAREGKHVFAVDNSPRFCKRTRDRARAEELTVRVIRADMRSFRLPERVDLVLCEFSALNNLDDRAGLVRVFESVARALKPGGHFLFDVNTPLSLQTQCGDTNWFETREFKLVLHCKPLEDRGRRVPIVCEWFVPSGRDFRHVRETIVNVCWSDAEIRTALKRAGLRLVRTFDGPQVRPPKMRTPRGTDAYYLACKPRD
jgi:SAM-dependent methyltransferase